MKRYRDKDTLDKFSTPSGQSISLPDKNHNSFNYYYVCWNFNFHLGHRGRQINLENMYGNKAEMDLMVADTMEERKNWTQIFEPHIQRKSRDLYRVYDW